MATERRVARWLGAAVLLIAGTQYAWNLCTLPPLTGYDADGHLHYVATLLDEGRLPHPLEGWSTFHPPLYHAVVALLEIPSGPAWQPLLVGAVSALAMLWVGAVAFRVTRRLGHAPGVAAVAAFVLLFTPCVQLAAITVGNEALAAAFCALALAGAVGLQRDPRDTQLAAISGLALGLALATKASALVVAPACAVPFLRRGLGRRGQRAVLVLLGTALVVGAPAYLRNAALTGTPLPMTRELPWVALNEQALTLRARRATDYLWIDPAVFADPRVADPAQPRGLNPSMTNVWGLLYASTWFDAHGLRTGDLPRDRTLTPGRVLLAAGLLPTGLVLLGFALALRDAVRARGRSRDGPLVVAALGGLAGLVAFTLRAPTTAAVKGAYLLPVAVCAPVFFARGVAVLGPASRRVALVGAALCGLAAALLLANGVWLPIHRPTHRPCSRRRSPRSRRTSTPRVPGAGAASASSPPRTAHSCGGSRRSHTPPSRRGDSASGATCCGTRCGAICHASAGARSSASRAPRTSTRAASHETRRRRRRLTPSGDPSRFACLRAEPRSQGPDRIRAS